MSWSGLETCDAELERSERALPERTPGAARSFPDDGDTRGQSDWLRQFPEDDHPVKMAMTYIPVAQTLSPEIVQQIFAPFSTTLFTNKLSRFPWFLGHISSTWRSVFLSMTNEFWSTIDIGLYNSEKRSIVESVVRFFLDRDPSAPLSFSLRVPKPDPITQNEYYIRQMLGMLAEESMRWKVVSLSIRGSPSTAHLSPLNRARDRLPLLRKFHAMLSGIQMKPNPLCDIFQTATSLDAIHITDLADWKFNWSDLKTIDVGLLGHDPSDFVPVLSQMSNLERLRIYDTFSNNISQSDCSASLPSLITLICGQSWLPFLKAPALQNLTIQHKLELPSPDLAVSFLRRSSCNILRLRIEGGVGATAVEIIRFTSQITHLVLSNMDDMGLALKQLIVSTRAPLAPHLSSLYIRYASGKEDIDPLVHLILSRTTSHAVDSSSCKRLQKLGLYMCNLSSATIRDFIALCKEHEVCYTDDPSF